MKRIIGLLLCLCTVLGVCFALTSCLPKVEVTYDENGIGYAKNDNSIVLGVKFDASGDSAEVTIPDEYNGTAVTSISGPTWPAFDCIPYGNDIIPYEGKIFDVDEELTFTLIFNIGKNLQRVFGVQGGDFYRETEDGHLIYYHVHYYYNCSDENETYFSKDGYLYDKIAYNGYYVDGVYYENKKPVYGIYGFHNDN